jgi:glycosyltransferase involved in cell wall biosynthesis
VNKLKILMVMRHSWGNKMGIPKVFYDFKQEYELMGHQVDTLSHSDLYPKKQNLLDKIIGPVFPELILKYLKKNASKYDIIDANFECVPYPKSAFNFNGVLLFRSHGLPQVYKIYEELPPYKMVLDDHRQKIKFKTRIGNIYRGVQRKVGLKELNASIKHADIVHVLNQAEHDFLLQEGVPKERLVMIPNGLEDKYIEEASKASVESKGNNISFVASWTLRKGITELNEILNSIRSKIEVEELHLLGGDQPKEVVLKQFENENFSKLKITPEFEQAELISLLSNAKVGIFPSYVEGFGLAVVEQLACGIPVVAYRVPGPTEILKELDESLLIASGDIESLTNKVVEILNMSESDYKKLAIRCKERAKAYSMRKVAGQFVGVYKKSIGS